ESKLALPAAIRSSAMSFGRCGGCSASRSPSHHSMLTIRPYSANSIGLGKTHSASARSLGMVENAGNFVRAIRRHKLKLYGQRLRSMLGLLDHPLHRSITVGTWMPKDRHAGVLRHDFAEQL